MFARRRKSSSPESRETTWLLTLVVLAVVLPTAGFLWFMTQAMSNERAVMLAQRTELHKLHLTDAQRLVNQTLKRLSSGQQPFLTEASLSDEQRFHRLHRRGFADSLLCLAEGIPIFPNLAHSLDGFTMTEADEKAMSLLEEWESTDGYPDLLETFKRDNCLTGRNNAGRLIYPNLQLTALQSLDPQSAIFSKIASELSAALSKRALDWPTSQRLFLATELRRLGMDVEVPSEAGFAFALDVLEHPIQLGQAEVLQQVSGMADAWHLLTRDRKFLLLFRTETIRAKLQQAARQGSGDHAEAIVVSPREGQLPAGASAPQWHLSLSEEALADATDPKQRRAFILAISCMLVALVGVIATFAIRRFLAQSRLTQLRNDFLSSISHELKTPLASTRMLVDTLIEGKVDDPSKAHNYLEVIGRENSRLSHLVENFLTYSRLESGKMPFDFREILPEEIVNQALDALESKLGSSNVDLQVSMPEDLPYIRADEATLCIALMNLLDNAYKYSGETKEIHLDVHAEGSHLKFAVKDNGIGLTASQRERVRERFFRVHEGEAAGGSGLGLSIVSDIVAAHDGELHIESLPGQGSIFTLSIPISGNR